LKQYLGTAERNTDSVFTMTRLNVLKKRRKMMQYVQFETILIFILNTSEEK